MVKGVNDYDEFSVSNGSGKTSMFMDSIVWLFTGYNSKGKKVEVMNEKSNFVEVEAEFKLNGIQYRMIRSKDSSGGHLTVYKDGEDEPYMDNAKKISQWLEENRLTLRTFSSILFMTQEMSGSFMESGPSSRKEIIEDLVGLDVAQKVQDLSKLLCDHYEKRITFLSGLSFRLVGQKTTFEQLLSSLSKYDYNKIVEEYNLLLYLFEKYKVEGHDCRKLEDSFNKGVMETKNKYYKLGMSLQEIEKDIRKLLSEKNSLKSGKCPYCNQEYKNEDKIAELEKSNSLLSEDKSKISKEIEGCSVVIDNQKKELELILKVGQLEKKLEEIRESKMYETRINSINKKILRINDKLSYFQEKLERCKKFINLLSRDLRAKMTARYFSVVQAELDLINSQFKVKIELKQEKSDINSYFQGKEYDKLSGGEAARCDIILQAALRNSYKIDSNIKVYDEVFDALDEAGITQVIDFLEEFNKPTDSTFIMSHNPNVNMNAKILTVRKRKDDGMSYLEI